MVMIMEDYMNCKIIKCGDVWEVVVFENPVKVGFKVSRDNKKHDEDSEKRFDNLVRARTAVRQLVLCNQTRYTKFLTLTYAVTNLDYDEVTHDFKMFIKNLKRNGFPNLPYLYVMEHQKERGKKEGNEGSLHIHCLLFTDEYIPFVKIKKSWGKRGSVDIQAIEDIHNLGAYVCKYITKEGYVGSNKPMYHVSRGLKRPEEKALYISGDAKGYEPFTRVKDVLDSLDIYYQNETQYTYDRGQGEEIQRIKYFQGKRKRG